jgi:hypothetical protein
LTSMHPELSWTPACGCHAAERRRALGGAFDDANVRPHGDSGGRAAVPGLSQTLLKHGSVV